MPLYECGCWITVTCSVACCLRNAVRGLASLLPVENRMARNQGPAVKQVKCQKHCAILLCGALYCAAEAMDQGTARQVGRQRGRWRPRGHQRCRAVASAAKVKGQSSEAPRRKSSCHGEWKSKCIRKCRQCQCRCVWGLAEKLPPPHFRTCTTRINKPVLYRYGTSTSFPRLN